MQIVISAKTQKLFNQNGGSILGRSGVAHIEWVVYKS
jgi:hypothetical protein